MAATVADFFAHQRAPAKPVAQIIPIKADTLHTPLTDAHRLALDFIRSLFWDARAGDLASLAALDILAHSHDEPQIRRLADKLVENLRRPHLKLVSVSSDDGSGGAA